MSLSTGGALLVVAALALGVAPQVAQSAAPPGAYTGEATELTFSSATVKGSVYPGDQATSYYFEYGLSTAYGMQTQTAVAGEGKQTIHVAAAITGLSLGTTYHYKLVAVNAFGARSGQDRTLKTKQVPLTFRLAATPSPDPFGSPLSLSGTLSGTGSANRPILLEGNPFPYLAGFTQIGSPASTDTDGGFSFSVPALAKNTELRVVTVGTPGVSSRAILARVAVRVSLHLRSTGRRGYVRMYGTVTPAEVGARVGFQLLRHGRAPVGIAGTIITGPAETFSRYSQIVRVRRAGLYRAVAFVANGAQVSGHSRASRIG